jgi:uncharacterized protein YhdP
MDSVMKASVWKKIGIVLVVLAVLIIAAVLVIPKLIDPNRYSGFIASQIEKAVGGKVNLGHITWGITHAIWLKADGFSIMGASAFPGDVKLTRIYAKVSIHPLLAKTIAVKELLLEGPAATVRLHPTKVPPKSTAGDDTTPSVGESLAGFPLPVKILIEKLAVQNGRITVEDSLTLPGQKVVHAFTDVEIEATNMSPGQEMGFQLTLRDEAKPGLGLLKAQGTFSGLTEALTLENPKLKLKADLSSLDMDAIKPYLRNGPLAQRLGGSVSLQLNYDGDFGTHLQADGLMDLTQFTYTDPSLWGKALPGAETKITYQVTLDPDLLTVEKIEVSLGNLTLSGQALVEGWRTEPVIKNVLLSADLPLAELIPLVPWGQLGKEAGTIRGVLERGGKATIEKASLPEIIPAKLTATPEALLPQIAATVRVSGLSAQPLPQLPDVEDITATLRLRKGTIKVEGLTARVGPASLPQITAEITDLLEKPEVAAHLHGQLKVSEITDEKTIKLLRERGIEKLAGTAELDLALHLETARPEHFSLQGNVGLRNFQLGTSLAPASLEGLNADIAMTPDAADISSLSTTVVVPAVENAPGGRFTVELNGKVDNWRDQPTVTLHSLRTSPVSLPALVPIVPWDKLGDSAQRIKEILLAGGTVSIEDLAFSKLDPKNLPRHPESLVSRIKGALSFADIAVRPSPTLPRLEGLTGRVNLEKGVLSASDVQARMGPLTLPTIGLRVTHLTDHPKVSAQVKGPLRIKGAGHTDLEKLLMEYGLKSLSGTADIDLTVQFDQARPKQWAASGSVVLDGIRAETHPTDVLLEDLRGRMTLSRKKTMDITVENFAARVNGAPIRLEGRLSGGETPQMVVDAKVQTQELDLAHVAALLPALGKLELGGKLDMNLNVHFPYAHPMKTRLQGRVKTRGVGLRLAAQGVTVKDGDTELQLVRDTVKIKGMTLRVNDQKVALTGLLTNPMEPNLRLHVKSPNLNVDRLLASIQEEKRSSKKGSGTKAKTPSKDKADKAEIPPLARNLTARLQVEAEQGQYQGQKFQDLRLIAHYERGVLKSYDFDVRIAGGRVRARGSADLRDLERVHFAVEPAISKVHLESIAPLLGTGKPPLEGPLTMTGQVRGRTGSSQDLLGSLRGNLDCEIGRGRLTNNIGRAGNLLVKILSIKDVLGVLSRRLIDDLTSKGMPFEHIETAVSFEGGSMNVSKLHFRSDALGINAQGTVDLVNQQLNMDVDLEPLATVDEVLGIVPMVVKGLQSETMLYLHLHGSLKDPKVGIMPAKRLTEGGKEEIKGVEEGIKALGKELKRLLEK